MKPPFKVAQDVIENPGKYIVSKLEPLWDEGRMESIRLDNPRLRATQEEIDQETLTKQASGEWSSGGSPVVIRNYDGMLYIQDGHHRLSSKKLSGEKSAEAWVIDLPKNYVWESFIRTTTLEDIMCEERIGSRGSVEYFQMGSSLPDHLYNLDSEGRPTRDPGLGGNTDKKIKKKREKKKKDKDRPEKRWYDK